MDIKSIILLLDAALVLINILKNKRIILTIVLNFILIFITLIFNVNYLIYGSGFVGINNSIFLLISALLTVIQIIIKIKYKAKEKIVSFVVPIIITLLFRVLTIPFSGGLVEENERYFAWNFSTYLLDLYIIILQLNLFIDFISQKAIFSGNNVVNIKNEEE